MMVAKTKLDNIVYIGEEKDYLTEFFNARRYDFFPHLAVIIPKEWT